MNPIKLNEYENYLKQNYLKTKRDNFMDVESSWKTCNLINDSFFEELRNYFSSNLEYFIRQLGFLKIREIEILNMWHNVSNRSDSLFPHIHKGSLISGAFYLKGGHNNYLTFHNRELFDDLFPSTEVENKLHYDYNEDLIST